MKKTSVAKKKEVIV